MNQEKARTHLWKRKEILRFTTGVTNNRDSIMTHGEHANVHQSHSQNDSGDLRGVAGGDGELGCLCGKAGTSRLCDGSAHSSGCVVNGSMLWLPF